MIKWSSIRFAILVAVFGFIYLPMLKAQEHHLIKIGGKRINPDSLQKEILSAMSEVDIPGLSLALIENNKVSYSAGYGKKMKDSSYVIDDNTVFEACSLSKTLLAYVVYKLADKRRIDLDRPMFEYLEYEPLKHDDRYKRITPRMVLSHSSGIENWKFFNNDTLLEILAEPGSKFVYSGEGYQYLAKVVEVILNMPYDRYINRMVIKPLRLKSTFLHYSADGRQPDNFCYGHNSFGERMDKWKNSKSLPAGGVHFTARDYAKLVVGIFRKNRLSARTKNQILDTIVSLREHLSPASYGPGFEIYYSDNDIIVSHGGSNPGFKGLMFYSIKGKNGFVILTNSDRGKLIAERISDLTVKMKIHPFFEKNVYEQYPSAANVLFSVYKNSGTDSLLSRLDLMRERNLITENTLNELGDIFKRTDTVLSEKLLRANLEIFPKCGQTYYQLALIAYDHQNYDIAYSNLLHAREVGFPEYALEDLIKKCLDHKIMPNK